MQGNGEMRRLPGVAAPGNRPRLYRREAELAALIGAAAPETREALVGRRIGLPQLDGGVRQRIAIIVDDPAGQRNPRARGAEPRQIGPLRVLDPVPEGPDCLTASGAWHGSGVHR